MKRLLAALAPFAFLAILETQPSYAQPAQYVAMENRATNPRRPDPFWTAERFRSAKPFLPPRGPFRVEDPASPPPRGEQPFAIEGRAPNEEIAAGAAEVQLFTGASAVNDGTSSDPTPTSAGTAGAHYTSTRVFPLFGGSVATYSADRAYPFRAVGKLFFSVNGSPSVCSASVINRRIVVTAGHCVHSGTASGFHSNFVFVPAFRDGVAPFQQWNWSYVITTSTWSTGGGRVPNAADYAMIEFEDRALTTGGAITRLGLVTGWLGFQTLALNNNHTSKLGYPCNLDNCQRMQSITSNSFRAVSPNNIEYGSDATGGSSGGPWVQNFQQLSAGGGSGSNAGTNRVVGVASYGYTDTNVKVQGASIPDNRWTTLFNTICARRTGNCS